MKMKYLIFAMASGALLFLTSCGTKLIEMQKMDNGEYMSIVWEGRTYVPFCVVSKNDCGKKIGYLNGDKKDIVSKYKDYVPEQWIANYLTTDGGAMLCKEISVKDSEIPDGLTDEYQIDVE